MADSDLVFGLPYDDSYPAALVFGDDGSIPVQDASFIVRGTLPSLRGKTRLAVGKDVRAAGRMPALQGRAVARYFSDTQRPTVNDTTGRFQQANTITDGRRTNWQEAQRVLAAARGRFENAEPQFAAFQAVFQQAKRVHTRRQVRFQIADPLELGPLRVVYQEGLRLRAAVQGRFQEAIRKPTPGLRLRYQDALRDRRNYAAVRFQRAAPYFSTWRHGMRQGVPLGHWWHARYQNAIKPPIGIWRPDPPEPEDPCYLPELPAHLVFSGLWVNSPHLVFLCDRHDGPGPEPGETIVVPVKEVYLTINSAVLIRVDTGQMIPTFAMSMTLDVDSWTWGFSASVPGAALPQVLSNNHGDPVVVQATVNGLDFRFALSPPARDRSFNSSAIRLQGRGLGAELDAPNSVVRTFANTENRNARQLLDDILTLNNVPIGWDIGIFEPLDWAVPAGVFSHTGTYISALNAVVGAVGGYIQPHNTARVLDVRLRYPKPAWEWSTVTPDFEIPDAVASQEGIEWVDKPLYNRVYVSGQEHGVLGRYTRTGTAGDLLAPEVIDPLITHADVVRQRGRTIISDTGRVATVTIKLPLLEETGLIKPGAFVRYIENGNEHLGLTRSVSLNAGLTDTYQTLTLETHVEPV